MDNDDPSGIDTGIDDDEMMRRNNSGPRTPQERVGASLAARDAPGGTNYAVDTDDEVFEIDDPADMPDAFDPHGRAIPLYKYQMQWRLRNRLVVLLLMLGMVLMIVMIISAAVFDLHEAEHVTAGAAIVAVCVFLAFVVGGWLRLNHPPRNIVAWLMFRPLDLLDTLATYLLGGTPRR